MKKLFVIALTLVIVLAGATTADAKKRKHRPRKQRTEEVWTHLSGMYAFTNGTNYFSIEFDGPDDIIVRASVDDEDCTGDYDKKTHLITLRNQQGEVIFTGKIYRGGNLLKGTLRGKPVKAENPCGL